MALAARDVQRNARHQAFKGADIRIYNVVDVGEVPTLRPIAVDRRRAAGKRFFDEERNYR